MPSNLFETCYSLTYINLKDNDLSNAPADLLQGLDLKSLLLHNCNLYEVPTFFTSQIFSTMDFFLADHNKISRIDPRAFVNAASLTKLSLSHNFIGSLHVDLLKYLNKLERVSFSYNRLRNIPEALFQYKPFLTYVDLSNNRIENIPMEAFLGTNLQELHLNENRLTHLPQNFITIFRNTRYSDNTFNFHGNPWECGYLNKLLVRIKMLGIGYDRSSYNGKVQACRINVPYYGILGYE